MQRKCRIKFPRSETGEEGAQNGLLFSTTALGCRFYRNSTRETVLKLLPFKFPEHAPQRSNAIHTTVPAPHITDYFKKHMYVIHRARTTGGFYLYIYLISSAVFISVNAAVTGTNAYGGINANGV